MHQNSLSSLVSQDFTSLFHSDRNTASDHLAKQNGEDIGEPIPENLVLPTGDDIRKFKTWEMQYRTKHPKASDREVRRAVVKQFNIVVVQGQNMISK